jgi:hypothetical protein
LQHTFRIILAAALLCAVISVRSAQAQIAVEMDSAYVETGSPCVLSILVPQSVGRFFNLDLSPWDSLIPIDNRLSIGEPVLVEHRQAYRVDLKCIFFEEDTLLLPPIGLFDDDTYLQSGVFTLAIRAAPAPAEVADMNGIRDIRREPINLSDLLPWIVGIGLALLLILCLFIWYARRNKNQFARQRLFEKTPSEQALARLEALRQKQYWQKGQVKTYYELLTHIYRQYLEKQHDIPALESNTHELLRYLENLRAYTPGQREAMHTFFQNADLAKFAKGLPPETYHDTAWDLVKNWTRDHHP